MTDHNRQYDLDDELLSAYIDNELSPEEHAAVEARLASDPAAQQLLHELRSVSQSVEAVPTEKLGRDLSDSVISIVRGAAPAGVVRGATTGVVRGSPDPAPSPDRRSPSATKNETSHHTSGEVRRPAPNASDDDMPRLRIFGSKRALIWAAMALAAGLLIMFLQPADNSKNLPQVAATNRGEPRNEAVDEAARQPRPDIAFSAAPKPEASKAESPTAPPLGSLADSERKLKPAAPAAAAPAAPAAATETNGRLAGGAADRAPAGAPSALPAANAPIAASSPTMQLSKEEAGIAQRRDDASALTDQPKPSQVAAEQPAATFKSFAKSAAKAPTLGIAEAREKMESSGNAAAPPNIVVQVVAKPDAIKSGAFDRVLAANNISFVSEPHAEPTGPFGGGKVLKEMKTGSADKLNKFADSRAADAVLVEAPRAAIERCLADLNKNSNDFVSVSVSEPAIAADRFDMKTAPAKQAAEVTGSLSHFSRGAAPESQKDSARLYEYYYGVNTPRESAVHDQLRSGGGALNDKAKSVATSGGETAPGFAGQSGPGPSAGPGRPAPTTALAISSADHDAKNGDDRYAIEHQLPTLRRARQMESTTADAPVPSAPSQSQAQSQSLSRSARNQTESAAMKKPSSQRSPAEAAADASNENMKVLFVFTPASVPAPGTPATNPSK
jgi:hypothetical protein